MRTSEELREKLFQTIDDLRAGKISPQQGAQIANIAGRIIDSVKIEIECASYREAYPKTASSTPPPLMLTETE